MSAAMDCALILLNCATVRLINGIKIDCLKVLIVAKSFPCPKTQDFGHVDIPWPKFYHK